jgi:hypothetical protein
MWFRRKPLEVHLDKELRYHFESLVRDFMTAGISAGEARRRARLEFGGLEQVKEDCRDVQGRWLEDFGKDLHYAARTLRRSPGFLAVAVLSLALGIGANTAIFSLINAVMLRSLPVKEPARLVQITRLTPTGKPGVVSYPLFQYFRDNLKSISVAAAQMSSNPAILMDGAEEVVNIEMVSGAHYSLLGMEPAGDGCSNRRTIQFRLRHQRRSSATGTGSGALASIPPRLGKHLPCGIRYSQSSGSRLRGTRARGPGRIRISRCPWS